MTQLDQLTNRELGGLKLVEVADTIGFLNLFVYGDPGVGKTVLATSACMVPEMSPVLVVDVEGGLLSSAQMGHDIDVVRTTTINEFNKVARALANGEGGYRTVVLDSLTEIQKLSMDLIMADVVREHSDRDPDIPSMREWGKNVAQVRKLVRFFRDLPMHTIVTALAKSDKDPKSGLTKTKPSMSGKLADEVGGWFDEMLYMYTKVQEDQIKRMLLTRKTDTTDAKDRSGRLETVVMDPSMSGLYDMMFNQAPETVTDH